jgi:uncharacterized protein (DUF427 family)
MPKAVWNGKIIAESETTQVVEGNHYFPADTINRQYFKSSDTTSICPWKGTASYYHIEVDGSVNSDAAWYYPDPRKAAEDIRDHVAFWKGVDVTD